MYFLQTEAWMNFWKKASGKSHNFESFECGGASATLEKIFVQEYPWYLGEKFWYLPKVSVGIWNEIRGQIVNRAKEKGVCFVKVDFDGEKDKIIFEKEWRVIWNSKKIQYLTCSVCDIQNENFIDSCNEQVRRYTRKILKDYEAGEYKISFEKTEKNFQAFWSVHFETAKRQSFSTQSKAYLNAMMLEDFGQIAIIRNKDDEPLSVFLGVKMDDTLYYILGGNTEIAMKNRVQYLLQDCVVKNARENGVRFYDMGGYEAGTGYSKFKDGYKGSIKQFVGPVDIVLKPIKYRVTNGLLKLKSYVRG
jgi:FemAB family